MPMPIITNQMPSPDELALLVNQCPSGRFLEDPDLPRTASERFVVDQLKTYLSGQGTQCVSALNRSRKLQGLLLYRLSQWDTEHFGYPVVVIDSIFSRDSDFSSGQGTVREMLSGLDVWCRRERVRMVSIRLSARDLPAIHALEDFDFRYIESYIVNKYDLKRNLHRLPKSAYTLRSATLEDRTAMLAYSKKAFVTHKFYADSRIEVAKADSLYDKWINQSFDQRHRQILVMERDSRPAAFMDMYANDLREYFGCRFMQWKMAVTDPEQRGLGLGTDFFVALLHHHANDGIDVVDSGLSARNIGSLNLHTKLGFKVICNQVTFHKWYY